MDVQMSKAILLLVAVFFKESSLHPTERIVGGHDVDIQDYPYMVSLEKFNSHICGGSIVAMNKILSAAHCTLGEIETYTVRANSSIRETGGIVYGVVKIRNHPLYNPIKYALDVTVLTVNGSLQYDVVLHSIPLIAKGQGVPDGTVGIVTGWGLLGFGLERAIILQALSVPKISSTECKEIFSVLEPSMICFGYHEENRDACVFDSGGPLVINNEQVGIVNFGAPDCGHPLPAVYAKVSAAKVRNFIDSSIIEP